MDAKGIHDGVSTALDKAGLQRQGRSRWIVRWPELLWMVQLDRSGAKAWALMFGALVRDWSAEEVPESYSDLHTLQEYVLHGDGLPASAAKTRFDDHPSFFTMVMDHTHALVRDDLRNEAFEYLAGDLASLFARATDPEHLVRAVQTDEVGGFLDRRLRDLAHGSG